MADDQQAANGNGGTDIKTPLGSISFRGKRAAEFISVLLAIGVGIMGYVLYDHKLDARDDDAALTAALNRLSESQDHMVQAQRELTCMLSLPQDKREAEFNSPNGLCKRLSR